MMKGRQIQCAIANKVVHVTLRSGGAFDEPETIHVRCSERDCQYVDVNQPPCPLRVGMFAAASDRDVALYLAARAGTRVCYPCIAAALDITHADVRRATWRLKDQAGVSIRPSGCGVCRRRGVTIGVASGVLLVIPEVGGDVTSTPSTAISAKALAEYLRARTDSAFCTHCLARHLQAAPAEVRDAMCPLEPELTFTIRTGLCVSCRQNRRVILHHDPALLDAPGRVIALLLEAGGAPQCDGCVALATDLGIGEVGEALATLETLPALDLREGACETCGRVKRVVGVRVADADDLALPGRLRHRGFHIDLLSFKTGQGWRPFALVKTANGVLAPDAPALVLGALPTKVEADAMAATHTRAWIDKRWGGGP